MRKFAAITTLVLFAATPVLAQSNSGGAMSSVAMANDHKASGSMSGSMSHGAMSGSMTAGAMSDHDKMAKPKKKAASGSMTGSMSGSMSNSSGH